MGVFASEKIYTETVSSVTATPSEQVGVLRRVGDDLYRYVYNTGNSQILPSYAATVSGVTGYSVTVSTVTSVDIVVGVCKNATLTTGTYGWLMVHGFCQVQMGAPSPSLSNKTCFNESARWQINS